MKKNSNKKTGQVRNTNVIPQWQQSMIVFMLALLFIYSLAVHQQYLNGYITEGQFKITLEFFKLFVILFLGKGVTSFVLKTLS